LNWIIVGEVALLLVAGVVLAATVGRSTGDGPSEQEEPNRSAPRVQRAEMGLSADEPGPADTPAGKPGPSHRTAKRPVYSDGGNPLPEGPLRDLDEPWIEVVKSHHRLTVYDGLFAVKHYRVAVGGNPGDKQIEGDRKTPEGEFFVCIRKDRGQSQYLLSLGLSYPNEEDAARGLRDGLIDRGQYAAIVEAVRTGRRPPWNTRLGGAIMIHGRRNDRNDTLGCIAMDDEDIIELYPRIPMGCRVVIRP
jgi:hypothetical protein